MFSNLSIIPTNEVVVTCVNLYVFCDDYIKMSEMSNCISLLECQLYEMGFNDPIANALAVERSKGDLNLAVHLLSSQEAGKLTVRSHSQKKKQKQKWKKQQQQHPLLTQIHTQTQIPPSPTKQSIQKHQQQSLEQPLYYAPSVLHPGQLYPPRPNQKPIQSDIDHKQSDFYEYKRNGMMVENNNRIEESELIGTVKMVDKERRFGFIASKDLLVTDCHFYFTDVEGYDGHNNIPDRGDILKFTKLFGHHKGPKAINLSFIHKIKRKHAAEETTILNGAPTTFRGEVTGISTDTKQHAYGFIDIYNTDQIIFFYQRDIKSAATAIIGDVVQFDIIEEPIIMKRAVHIELLTKQLKTESDVISMTLQRSSLIPAIIPKYFIYHDTIEQDESRHLEFKSAHSINRAEGIINVAEKYLNAFLNTEGGCICFGIEDNGTISGITLKRSERDEINKRLDSAMKGMKPTAVTHDLYTFEWIKIYEPITLANNTVMYLPRDSMVLCIAVKKANTLYETKFGKLYCMGLYCVYHVVAPVTFFSNCRVLYAAYWNV